MFIITGSQGFIGSQLVNHLNQKHPGQLLVGVDPKTPMERPGLILDSARYLYLRRDQIWEQLEQKQKPEWIFHMGANSSTTERNWEHLEENNILYSQKVFQWCARNSVPLIYASSAATYGAGESGYSDRCPTSSLRPLNLYGRSKLLFDEWALQQKETPPRWYGLKFFNVFGPGEQFKGDMASLVFKSYFQIQSQGSVRLFKSYHPKYQDGEQMRDFVYVKELCDWMIELTEKRPPSGVYNMGYGQARTWKDLVTATFKSMNKDVKIDFIEMPESLKNQYQYWTEADMSTWKQIGMSDPKWPLEKAIADYVQNHLRHLKVKD